MDTCRCGQPLWAPESKVRGYCEYCRIYGPPEPGSRVFPYTLPEGYVPPDKREKESD
jgi:hypothetical protein